MQAGATYPFTFVTAYCLPVYASQCLFPSCIHGPPTAQNSVPGCWLNFARATISSHQTLCASRRTPPRTRREPLGSPGSHHPAVGRAPICQCGNSSGSVRAILPSQYSALRRCPLSFLNFLVAHLTKLRFSCRNVG